MDVYLKKQLHENSFSYKRSLDRIIDKYSKLYYHDGGVEVDLDQAKPQTVERYMKLAKVELNKLESKSLTELREDSLRAQDITRHSQLDSTHQDGGADETCVSSGQFSADGDGMARSDTTQLTVSSLDESQRNSSETELQPEDQDEELEMTLRSRGSSFVELYPSMISRIERAWHRQNVSEAADSVLRRYRRWRQQSNRSSLNNTFIVSLRHPNSNPRKVTMKTLLEENSNSPGKRQFMRLEPAPRSPLQIATNLQALQAQQLSPERERGSLRREQHRPILAMDLSGLSEISEPKEISLNETFTVSELSRLGEQPCPYPTSPSRPYYPTTKASLDLSLRSKRLSLSAHSEQATGRSTYESEIAAVKERPDTYSSPVRPSPLKARMMTSLDRSPHSFSRSPKEYSAESFSREPMRPRSKSTSLSSPPQKPPVPLRVLYPQESHLSLQPQLRSPQPAKAEGRLRLRRHLSFDSSLPSIHVSYSPKKLDEDFIKLYHKFVCQNQSFFNGPPCRLCARSSEASRGHSSSALAALALSPHRSVLRKRHRELGWGGHPQSKRSRDECCKSSPGSKRHGNEMLRRCLAPSELSHDGLSYSSSRHATFNKFSTQQRSADAHQEAWMRRGQPVSAAEFSGLGVSLERSIANGYPPSVQKMVVSTDHL